MTYELCRLEHYMQKIKALPSHEPLRKEDLLTSDFLIDRQDGLDMYYSPHNEYINHQAQLVILGITPGWTQMELAYRQARNDLHHGLPLQEIAKRAKLTARFAGPMRYNLIDMLDRIGLHSMFGISSCSELFNDHHESLHTTSIIKFPVFIKGSINYSGHQPPLVKSAFLLDFVCSTFAAEMSQLTYPLLLPLGKMVEDTLKVLISRGLLDARQCLFGFPHPSGANGHRHKKLERNLSALKRQVQVFYSDK